MGAMRVQAEDRLRVRVEAPDFGDVHRGCRALWDLRKAHGRPGVHHAGIDGQATRVDRPGACGYGHVGPDGGDLAVADHHRAASDLRPTHGDDLGVRDRVRAPRTWHRVV